mgnify:FL=1
MKKIKSYSLGIVLLLGLNFNSNLLAADEVDQGIEEVIVTARRTEESLQEVPVAVTAFSTEGIEARQIINTSDIQLNVPNVSFTNTNFSGNSFSIRGIGRLVTAGTGEAGVSAHMNDIPIVSNLVTTEYYDMERIEVLRGPQGTLYGRNATGGVVNFITKKPEMGSVGGYLEAEVGDYSHQRVRYAINLPLGERLAIRAAGSTLERDGYTENLFELSDGDIDGRDQEDYRISLRWEGDSTSIDLMHQSYDEDSDRARITNQVCKENPLPTYGCLSDQFGRDGINPGSSTGTMYISFGGIFPLGQNSSALNALGLYQYPRPSNMNLRQMHSDFEPIFKSESEQTYLTISQDVGDYTFTFNYAEAEGTLDSQQDYNMDVGPSFTPLNFNTVPPTPNALTGTDLMIPVSGTTCGIACEQLGTAGVLGGDSIGSFNRVYSYDKSYTDMSETEYGEIKVQSNLDGNINFVLGMNQTDTESHGGYYVNSNSLDFISIYGLAPIGVPQLYPGFFHNDAFSYADRESYFGEVYVDLSDSLRLTVGYRKNEDEKWTKDRSSLANAANLGPALGLSGAAWVRSSLTGCLTDIVANAGAILTGAQSNACPAATPLLNYYNVKSAVDAATLATLGGDPTGAAQVAAALLQVPPTPGYNESRILSGSPTQAVWEESTSKVGLDWKIDEDTMAYLNFSKGFKPGGFNPAINDSFPLDTPRVFDSEKVDAIEVGFKTSLLDRRMQLNGSYFSYDYKGLQIYKIINNSSVNVNVDADIQGAELEMLFIPEFDPDILVDVMFSWLETKAADNLLLDPKDRAQGDSNWIVLKNIDSGSATGVQYVANAAGAVGAAAICGGLGACIPAPNTISPSGVPVYMSRTFLNAIGVPTSDGVLTNIKGNALPNAPEYTLKLGIQKTWYPSDGIDLTARFDYYMQDESFAREFNRSWDKIDSWDQLNFSLMLQDSEGDWSVRAWVRNLSDDNNVTGHYVTSDTSGMYTNYFLTEPRVYGATFRVNF